MADWFPTDIGRTNDGFVYSARATIALEIVKHFALVNGAPDGEDSAGRAKLRLLEPREVADRANQIADALVTNWERDGWIRPTTLTPEQDWEQVGHLHRIQSHVEYMPTPEQEQRIKDRMATRMNTRTDDTP